MSAHAFDKGGGQGQGPVSIVEQVGGLDGARLVEPVGMLNIRLGYGLGRGTSIAPAWLKI